MNPLNPYFGEIFQIKSQSRCLDSWSERFFGNGFKKNFIWQAVFHANVLVPFAVLFLSRFRIIGNSGILLLIFWKLFVKQADKHEQVKIASFAYQRFFYGT